MGSCGMGIEDAVSIMHWRRASQGPKPDGLGDLSTFCSVEPYLLCVLTWPGLLWRKQSFQLLKSPSVSLPAVI